MFRRKVYDRLVRWKETTDHKSLIVKGARQVGKTFIIRRFAEDHYSNYVELNFITNPEYKAIFDGNLNVGELLYRISLFFGENPLGKGDLLFLDEIQDCPRARQALKVFTEDGRIDVIASGSMLGVYESRLGIYKTEEPLHIGVGYEETITMHALDFEEFLWARNVPLDSINRLKRCIHDREPLDDVTFEVLSGHFRTFMLTGGMPESVDALLNGENGEFIKVLDRLVHSIKEDIHRYNRGIDIVKVGQCFDSIPPQLCETNKKFTFSKVDGGSPDHSTKQKYFDNTVWIGAAGYGNFCYLTKQPTLSLKAQEIIDQYRIYLFDTGLLTNIYGPAARQAILSDDHSYNQSALAENVVAECLVKGGIQPRCYRKTNGNNRMELDFVVELGTELCVIEVKSGKHREFPSMSKVSEVYPVDRRILLEKGNIHVDDDGVEHYPLFAAAFMDEMIHESEGYDRNGLPLGGL